MKRKRQKYVNKFVGTLAATTVVGAVMLVTETDTAQANTNGTATILDVNFQEMNFNDGSKISGTDKEKGAVYLYKNVFEKDGITVDAKVTIVEKENANLGTIDDNSKSGDKARFQPTIASGTDGGYVNFKFEFVNSSTKEPVLLENFYLTSVDLDGSSSSQEYNEISGFSKYKVNNPTKLSIETLDNGRTLFRGRADSLSGISFENTCAYIAEYKAPVSTLNVVLGNTGYTGKSSESNSFRQFSVSFGKEAGKFTTEKETINGSIPTITTKIDSIKNNLAEISGTTTAETGQTVTITLKDSANKTEHLTTTVQSGGNYSLQVDLSSFVDGQVTATANVVNKNGNPAVPVTASTMKDTTVPTATFTPVDNTTDVEITSNLELTFSEAVQAESGRIIKIRKVADDSVVASLAANDPRVTINGTQVTIDPTEDLAHSTEYYVEVEGDAFTDLAGNAYAGITSKGTWSFTTVAEQDTTGPDGATFTPNKTTATKGPVEVTIYYPADAIVKEYKIGENGEWTAYTGPVSVTSNGPIYARSQDAAGNGSEVTSYVVTNIDTDGPAGATFTPSTTTATKGPVEVTIYYPAEAIVKEYKIGENGEWTSYTGPVSVTSNGPIYARSQDAAGNGSEETSYEVTNIDTDGPAGATFKPSTTTATKGPVEVTIYYPAEAIVKEYKIGENGEWTAYTEPVSVTSNGPIYAHSQDAAGNGSEVTSYEVTNIDTTAPIAVSLSIDSYTIHESSANDGSVTDTQIVTLTNGTFASTTTKDSVMITNLPQGLDYNIVQISSNQLRIDFTGKAYNHTNGNDINNATIIVKQSAIIGTTEDIKSDTFSFDFNDPYHVPSISVGSKTIYESAANDGSVIDSQIVTVTNGPFDSTTKDSITIINLPDGLDYDVEQISDTELRINFIGAAVNHENVHDVVDARIVVGQSGITGATEDVTSDPFVFDFNDANQISYLTVRSPVIYESSDNDGSVLGTQIVTLTNGTFASVTTKDSVTITNLPEGLDYDVERLNDTELRITFTGKATNHANANDRTDATITVKQAAIIGATEDVTSSAFSFDFNDSVSDNITVAISTVGNTDDNTPVIAGSTNASLGSTVKVTINHKEYTTTVDASGNWQIILPEYDALEDGKTYQIVAKVIDSKTYEEATSTGSLQIDSNIEVTISAPSNNEILKDNTPVFKGLTEKNAIVTIIIDGKRDEKVNVLADKNGEWMYIPVKPIENGLHTISVTAVDYRGNTNTAESIFTIEADSVQAIISLTSNPSSIIGDGKSQAKLTATVVMVDGTPVVGTKVIFTAEDVTLSNIEVITDENGKASIIVTSPKIESIYPVTKIVTAKVNDKERNLVAEEQMKITFLPASITGVMTVNGIPIPNAEVHVAEDFNGDGVIDFENTVITDSEGKYSIPVPKSNHEYTVILKKATVRIGESEVSIENIPQKAQVGEIDGVGKEVTSNNTFSGQLFIKSKDGEIQSFDKLKDAQSGTTPNLKIQVYKKGETTVDSSVQVPEQNNGGKFEISNLQKNQEYEVVIAVEAVDPVTKETITLAGQKMIVSLSEDGEMEVGAGLIDPYGTITDSVTGQTISNVKVMLRWANTPLNLSKNRTPGGIVDLPLVPNFPPANNADPQWSDENGFYAWMVFADGDYYITAEKDGYKQYDSRNEGDDKDWPAVDPSSPEYDSYIDDGIIHVGQTIVPFSFNLEKIIGNNASSGDGGSSIPVDKDTFVKIISPSDAGETDDLTPSIVGEGEPGASIAISIDNAPFIRIIVDSNGDWSYTPTLELSYGDHIINVNATDKVGNKAAVTSRFIIVKDIEKSVSHRLYIKGYSDGTFKPENPITRAELACFISRNMFITEPAQIEPSTFEDVAPNFWAGKHISLMNKEKILVGFNDGTFKPNNKVTRAEFAAAVARYMKLKIVDINSIKDVPVGYWAKDEIEAVKVAGIMDGYTDGSFKPNQFVTRAEAVTVINKIFNRGQLMNASKQKWPDVSPTHWAYHAIEEASRSHLSIPDEAGKENWLADTEEDSW